MSYEGQFLSAPNSTPVLTPGTREMLGGQTGVVKRERAFSGSRTFPFSGHVVWPLCHLPLGLKNAKRKHPEAMQDISILKGSRKPSYFTMLG